MLQIVCNCICRRTFGIPVELSVTCDSQSEDDRQIAVVWPSQRKQLSRTGPAACGRPCPERRCDHEGCASHWIWLWALSVLTGGPAWAAEGGKGASEAIFIGQIVVLMVVGRLLGEAMLRLRQPAVMG